MQHKKDIVVLITGGAAGIGRAAALQFAQGGARVVVTGRREAPLQALAAEHPGIGYVVADAGKAEDAPRTIAAVIERHGRLDVLVNNAGAGAILPLADADAAQVRDIFEVNVIGPSLLARAALPHLEASRGVILNLSSTFGHKAGALLGPRTGAARHPRQRDRRRTDRDRLPGRADGTHAGADPGREGR